METCTNCGEEISLSYFYNNKTFCSACYEEALHYGELRKKRKSRKIRGHKIITQVDIDRNIQLLKEGKDLDVPLRRLKNFAEDFEERNVPTTLPKFIEYIPKPKTEYTFECIYCGKEFASNRKKKLCSRECRRKRLNQRALINHHKRMSSDWQFALKVRLRDNLRDAIRYYNKTGKLRKHVRSGKYIDYEAVIKSLGECPGSRRKWHIDHIRPLCDFDFSKTEEIKKAFTPSNLRWISAKDNLKKGRRI